MRKKAWYGYGEKLELRKSREVERIRRERTQGSPRAPMLDGSRGGSRASGVPTFDRRLDFVKYLLRLGDGTSSGHVYPESNDIDSGHSKKRRRLFKRKLFTDLM